MSPKIKILYVDDEDINLMLFDINFSKKHEVYTALNGSLALEVLDKHPDITIVISDMRMPQMTGLEFIAIAKKKYPRKKFYILTGFSITEEIQTALDKQLIIKYFQKPFNYNEIENAIYEAVDDKE